jgi:lipoate-protein ligase B
MAAAAKTVVNRVRPTVAHHLCLGRTTYHAAGELQYALANRFLASKNPPHPHPPPPTIITAEFNPVYTLGRRDLHTPLTAIQEAHLLAGGRSSIAHSARGGQTTFHGPGQLVSYVVIDLIPFGLTPRRYIRLLENSVIDTIAEFGIDGRTTESPGVWTSHGGKELEKIAAVGVHMRRNVTSFGVAINISTDLWWFDRIVACGLPEAKATSLIRCLGGGQDVGVDEVGKVWGEMLGRKLGVEDVITLRIDRSTSLVNL